MLGTYIYIYPQVLLRHFGRQYPQAVTNSRIAMRKTIALPHTPAQGTQWPRHNIDTIICVMVKGNRKLIPIIYTTCSAFVKMRAVEVIVLCSKIGNCVLASRYEDHCLSSGPWRSFGPCQTRNPSFGDRRGGCSKLTATQAKAVRLFTSF